MQRLKKWLDSNLLVHQNLAAGRLRVNDKIFYLVPPTNDKILDLKGGKIQLILDPYGKKLRDEDKIDYFVFEFGGWYYYTPVNKTKLKELTLLRYFGEYQWMSPIPEESRIYLGIHGKHEIMCGMHEYKEWAKKAKFLGYTSLGICEKETLAGVIQFSHACNDVGIKPILGVQFPIKAIGGYYNLKLFAVNQEGWENLLLHNTSLSSEMLRHEDILKGLAGTIALIQPSHVVDDVILNSINEEADQAYYQYTTTENYIKGDHEKEQQNMKWFMNNYHGEVKGVLMNDSYCLEEDQEHLQEILVTHGGSRGTMTKNHSLLPYDDIVHQFSQYFDEDKKPKLREVMHNSIAAFKSINEAVDFQIEEGKRFLPKYEMTEIEKESYPDNEALFKDLISAGLERLIDFDIYPMEEVIERIKKEGALIKKGEVIDYFLILWDIIKWAEDNRIQVGPGRGSAAGSLISYCLGITKVNPLEYELLFERFLDESRVTTSLPDIDVDFASDGREAVIDYIKDRYGEGFVCQVGTYGTLKLKSALKELSRFYGLGTNEHINFLTKIFDDSESDFIDIFKKIGSSSDKRLIQFTKKYYPAINDISSLIGSLKNRSVHACATIIAPKIGKGIKRQIPLRVGEDGTLVSEWEGGELDDAGYLKEDILSTIQMAKIGNMINLVEKNHGIKIKTEEIPLNDPEVYNTFCRGLTQDVFQFGSSGLTAYLVSMQPKQMSDLIAATALYRPGAMASKSHTEYILLKNGEKQPKYDYRLKEVTEETYGLYVYQEQIMKAVQVLGGFTLAEANGVRKAMGKKIKKKMDEYGSKFIKGAERNGCDPDEAKAIWEKLQVFSGYGFNKSHSAAYSVIGYFCNWFKVHYPLEFWITAFEYSDDEKIANFISELTKSTKITLSPPNINKSTSHFTYDLDKNTIYWDLSKIKFIGDMSVEAIVLDRDENGQFFSIKEFWDRMKEFNKERVGSKVTAVNKRTMIQLTLAGAFDEMYGIIKDTICRRAVVMQDIYEKIFKEDILEEYHSNSTFNPYWGVKQYEVCKLSNLNYKTIVSEDDQFYSYLDDYVDGDQFNTLSKTRPVVVIGLVNNVLIRTTKKGDPYAMLELLHNTDIIHVRIWSGELVNEKGDSRFKYSYKKNIHNEEKDKMEWVDIECDMKTMLERHSGRMVIMRGNVQMPDQWKSHNELMISSRMKGLLVKFL